MTNQEQYELICEKAKKYDRLVEVLNKIRAEIYLLHHHPKLDFIKNDEVVEMVLEVIDKYR